MLSLFHALLSRSSPIATLIDEMAIGDRVRTPDVAIPRLDGSGHHDPANPHPEGKAPALLLDGSVITERSAVILALTTLVPDTGLAPRPVTAEWGAYLTWLFWCGYVMEPVLIQAAAGVSHPDLQAAMRGVPEVTARLATALAHPPLSARRHSQRRRSAGLFALCLVQRCHAGYPGDPRLGGAGSGPTLGKADTGAGCCGIAGPDGGGVTPKGPGQGPEPATRPLSGVNSPGSGPDPAGP